MSIDGGEVTATQIETPPRLRHWHVSMARATTGDDSPSGARTRGRAHSAIYARMLNAAA
jgi:hypothetical protein